MNCLPWEDTSFLYDKNSIPTRAPNKVLSIVKPGIEGGGLESWIWGVAIRFPTVPLRMIVVNLGWIVKPALEPDRTIGPNGTSICQRPVASDVAVCPDGLALIVTPWTGFPWVSTTWPSIVTVGWDWVVANGSEVIESAAGRELRDAAIRRIMIDLDAKELADFPAGTLRRQGLPKTMRSIVLDIS